MEESTSVLDDRPSPFDWVAKLSFLTLVIAAAVNPVNLMTSIEFERQTQSNSPILLAKLCVAGIAALLGVWIWFTSPNVRRSMFSIPGACLVALAIVFCLTSLFAGVGSPANPMISRAAAMIFVAYLLFTLGAVQRLQPHSFLLALLLGVVANLLVTLALYVFVPSRGVFHEYISATETVPRMGGTAHPNGVAITAITAVLIALGIRFGRPRGEGRGLLQRDAETERAVSTSWEISVGSQSLRLNRWLVFAVLIGVVAALAALSRTAILAGGIATCFLLFHWFSRRAVVLSVVMLITLGIGTALLTSMSTGKDPFSSSAVAAVTKSGKLEELTSMTGRTVIWAQAIDWIKQRPWTGWGLDSSASVMTGPTAGTHNLMLNTCFSAGLVAGGILLVLLLWSLRSAFVQPYPWIRGILVYVLVSGLVEDTIFDSFPNALSLAWIAALVAPSIYSASLKDEEGSGGVDLLSTPARSLGG